MLQELQAVEDEPAQKVMQEVRRHHYPSPWGRPSQGDREAIETITVDETRAHFEKMFQPQGTILGVAGRFDWQELKDTVERLFGDWQPADVAQFSETPPPLRSRHIVYDGQQTQIGIAYPSVPYRDADYFQAWGGRRRVEPAA